MSLSVPRFLSEYEKLHACTSLRSMSLLHDKSEQSSEYCILKITLWRNIDRNISQNHNFNDNHPTTDNNDK